MAAAAIGLLPGSGWAGAARLGAEAQDCSTFAMSSRRVSKYFSGGRASSAGRGGAGGGVAGAGEHRPTARLQAGREPRQGRGQLRVGCVLRGNGRG